MRRAADFTPIWRSGPGPVAAGSVSGGETIVSGEVDDFKFDASSSGAAGGYEFAIDSAP